MSTEIRAQNSLALTSVKAIKDATDESASLLESMRQSAEDAGTTLTGIYADAESAKTNAGIAQQSAETAVTQLSVVENVVGVLDLVSKNGTYGLTSDTEVTPNKWYFTRTGTAPNYMYQVVQNPTGDPSTQGWYELTGIDEAIQNYVSSQLVVDDSGLWLKTAGMQTKVLLSSTDGVVLHGTDGTVVGKYGSTAQIGDGAGFHIEMGAWYKLTEDTAIDITKTYYTRTGTASTGYVYTAVESPVVADIGTYYEKMPPELAFYDGQNKVAYIRNDKLFIEQSVVVKQMDVGLPYGQINPSTGEVGLGQWSWKVHPNSENPKRNNLYLKWIG